jgi:hypothetical protein
LAIAPKKTLLFCVYAKNGLDLLHPCKKLILTSSATGRNGLSKGLGDNPRYAIYQIAFFTKALPFCNCAKNVDYAPFFCAVEKTA